MTWFDDGIRVKLYVSTSGDFVNLGTRTDYPFVAGGGGIPSGWTFWTDGTASDVNVTTAYGRFSVSNANPESTPNSKLFGIYRDFNWEAGHTYLINAQAQVMEGKSATYRQVLYQYNGTGSRYGSTRIAVSPWEQISLPPLNPSTFIRVYLVANPYWQYAKDFQFDWGVQFQSFAMLDMAASYPDPTWHEVTCDGKDFTIRYGRSKFTGRYDVGSCAITLNNQNGEYTYDPNHEWGLRPGRFVKVVAEMGGTTYPMFYGLIDSLTDAYTLDGKAGVAIQCVDTSSLLSNTEVPTMSSTGTTYWSGGRFMQVYRAAAWLPQMASIDNGVFSQQSILANGRSLRDELGLIADSEGGWFFTDRTGRSIYRGRDAPTRIAQWNTVQAELLAECPDFLERVKLEFPGVSGNAMQTAYQEYGNMFDVCAKVTMRDVDSADEQCIWSNGVNYFSKQGGGTKNLVARIGANTVVSTVPLPYNDGDTFWIRCRKDYLYRIMFDHLPADDSNDIPNVNNMTRLGVTFSAQGVTTPAPTEMINFGAFGPNADQRPLNGRVWRIMWQLSPSNNPLVDLNPDAMDGYSGAISVPLAVPFGTMARVLQTGTYELVQPDPDQPTNTLIPVDNIPTDPDATIVLLQNLVTDWSRDRVVNDVQLANQNGSSFQFIDTDSQSKYGPRTFQRLDLVNVNDHPEYLTQRASDIMTGYTEAVVRVNAVDFRPNVDTYEWALTTFLNDLVRVRYSNSRAGWGYAVASHIQQIQHTISTTDWRVQLLLDDAEAFNRWDDAESGTGWDEAIWDEGRWDGAVTALWNRESQWSDGVSVWK